MLTDTELTDDVAVRGEHAAFRDRLLDAQLLVDTGLAGCYAHSQLFEEVVSAVTRAVSKSGESDGHATSLRLPGLMPRSLMRQTKYLTSFPHLVGSVHGFSGTHREHAELVARAAAGGDWGAALTSTDAVLCPAACHQIYPLCSTGVPQAGRRFDVVGQCFRAEPSPDPARMQSFRMHEHVFVGSSADALAHRDTWLVRAREILAGFGLRVTVQPANDPFFGRLSSSLVEGQLHKELKYEVLATASSALRPTALVSANYHEDHFGTAFGITTPDGVTAHTACVGFGLERVTLALFAEHGLDISRWPRDVRAAMDDS